MNFHEINGSLMGGALDGLAAAAESLRKSTAENQERKLVAHWSAEAARLQSQVDDLTAQLAERDEEVSRATLRLAAYAAMTEGQKLHLENVEWKLERANEWLLHQTGRSYALEQLHKETSGPGVTPADVDTQHSARLDALWREYMSKATVDGKVPERYLAPGKLTDAQEDRRRALLQKEVDRGRALAAAAAKLGRPAAPQR